jgi:hypothetical protein
VITYAGIPLLWPTDEVRAWVEEHCRPGDLPPPVQPPAWPGTACEPWALRAHEGWQPPIRLNRLWWPTGASRFAVGHFLCTSSDLPKLRHAAYHALGSYAARPLVMDDEAGGKIETDLFLLPPRPLAFIEGEEQLWLLTFVDARYLWRSASASLTVEGGVTTWSGMYGAIAAVLGVDINVDAIAAAYLKPSEELTARYESIPHLLDAVAVNVGHRIVRRLDGSVYAQGWAAARLWQNNQLTKWDRAEGGGIFALDAQRGKLGHDLPGQTPAALDLVCPRTDNGEPAATLYARRITLASLALPQYDGVRTHAGSKVIHNSAVAAYAGGDDPANVAELLALGQQIARDWYRWRLGRQTQRYAGTVPYVPEGLSDFVAWELGEKAHTYVERGTVDPHLTKLNHRGTGTPGSLTPVVPGLWGDGYQTIYLTNLYVYGWSYFYGEVTYYDQVTYHQTVTYNEQVTYNEYVTYNDYVYFQQNTYFYSETNFYDQTNFYYDAVFHNYATFNQYVTYNNLVQYFDEVTYHDLVIFNEYVTFQEFVTYNQQVTYNEQATFNYPVVFNANITFNASLTYPPTATTWGTNQTDYLLPFTANLLTPTLTAPGVILYSMQPPLDGQARTVQIMVLGNEPLTITPDDGSTGTASWRFLTPDGLPLELTPGVLYPVVYSPTEQRWRIGTATGGGSYTDEEAQDAVGSLLDTTATVELVYDDGTPSITANVIPAGIQLDNLGAPDDNTDLNATAGAHGLLPKLSNVVTEFLNGQGGWTVPGGSSYTDEEAQDAVGGILDDTATVQLVYNDGVPNIVANVIPAGIPLDDLGSPADNTDLNASTSAHGLLKKLSNVSTEFMNGVGNWATPAAALPTTYGDGSTIYSLPTWHKFTIPYNHASLNVAATSANVTLFTAPTGTFCHGSVLKASAQFTYSGFGGSLNLTVGGNSANFDEWSTISHVVTNATSNTHYNAQAVNSTFFSGNSFASTDIKARFAGSMGDLNTLNAGSVDIYLLLSRIA